MSKLILGTSNADYHSNTSHLSSSGLKLLLKDAKAFEHEYILGNRQNVEKDAFTEGSLVHTLILEPHKIGDYAVFPGLRKHGILFETFKKSNIGKTIISAAQMLRAEKLVKAYECMPAAVKLMESTLSEHNMVSSILDVPVKARADAISVSRKCIIDVKTTAMPSDADVFKQTVADYMYELSAALYCQIAFNTYNELHDFYWIVLSKADGGCHIYKASTETLSRGTALVMQAIVKYKNCMTSGIWQDDISQKHLYDTSQYEIIEI